MIGLLQGQLKQISDTEALIIASGVGYLVTVSPQLLANKPDSIFIYTHVKEDKLDLYGFSSWEERSLFMLLLSVSGVGPSTAYAIVAAGHEQIVEAVQTAQVSFFKSIPRVGKKLAQKIIIELSSKLGELKALKLEQATGPWAELREALQQLGYSDAEFESLQDQLDLSEGQIDSHLKQALKLLQQNS